MAWSFRYLLRAYSGVLVWALVLAVLTWLDFDPARYVGHRPDLQHLIAPALHTVRNAQLLWMGAGIGVLFGVTRAVTSRVQTRSTRHGVAVLGLLLAGYAGGWWLGQRAFHRYFADEYYTIWKYEYGELTAPPAFSSPTLLARALHDVRNPAEPWHSRYKLVFKLGFSGAQPAFPVLQALAQNRTPNPELRYNSLLAPLVLDFARFRALPATLPDG